MRNIWFIATFVLLVFVGCKKDDDLNKVPEITYESISETTVLTFENSVVISFSYADQNGDLGFEDPDMYALRVKDARLSDYDFYHIPPLTPDLQELDIKGSFSVTLDPLFILGNSDSETTRFTLQVRDREGNWSNTIETAEVTIVESL